MKRILILSISTLFTSLCLAKSPFTGDIGKVYEFHDNYAASGNMYNYDYNYQSNNDWQKGNECLNSKYSGTDFMTSNGTKCYVRELPQSDVKTYFNSKADGSFGAGFSWKLD